MTARICRPRHQARQAGTLRLDVDFRDGDRAEVSSVAAPSLDDLAEHSRCSTRHDTELTAIDRPDEQTLYVTPLPR